MLAATGYALVASLLGVWCFVLLLTAVVLYATSQGEYNRLVPQRCPELFEQYQLPERPWSQWSIRRTFGNVHDSRITKDAELTSLTMLALASGIVPVWFLIGIVAGAVLASVL